MDVCPSCQTRLHYHFKEDAKKQEEIIEEERTFHFDDPDVESTGFKLEEEKVIDPVEKAIRDNINNDVSSYFDGNVFQKAGWKILGFLVAILTLFLGLPWSVCMVKRWETKHTVINGFRLKFDGKGKQLFGRNLLWMLLTILTVGLFSFWYATAMKRWTVKHTIFDLEGMDD